MNEKLLSYVWKYRLFNTQLQTTSGIPVSVIKPGEQHHHAGPDFFNARVRVGSTLWAGNVEIHVKASDWYRHGHQTDRSYDNVVLHVVYEHDTDIIHPDHTIVPTVALAEQMNEDVLRRFASIQSSRLEIPCGKQLPEVEQIVLDSWTERMLVERLEHKSGLIDLALHANHNDWEDAFYQLLARNFGFKVNAQPFEMLARVLPRKVLLRHADQPQQVEAMVLGQAGLLEGEFADEYARMLQLDYRFLARKYGWMPLDRHLWKLLRMRPANFPTIRLSQFAALVTQDGFSFAKLLHQYDLETLRQKLEVTASPYWSTRYVFDKPAPFSVKQMGSDSIDNIIINTIAPAMFYYGRARGDLSTVEKSMDLLRSVQPEKNSITTAWNQFGWKPKNAFDSQALLGLHANYCSFKKCLDCAIGKKIIGH